MGAVNKREHYDVAVVGGGIGGLYCCLKAPAGKRIALFEATGRIGGRVETTELGGFLAEWGSMRFDPGRQPIVRQFIRDLRLETQPFPEYAAPPADAGRQGVFGLEKDERGLNALQLFALGIARVLGMTVSGMMSCSDDELEHIRRKGVYRNVPLWQEGLWNVLSEVLSYGALKYLMAEGSFFHGVHENPGAAGTMLIWVKMLQMSEHLKGIKGGMQLITDRMLDAVKARGAAVRTEHSLKAVSSHGKHVTLTFDKGEFTAREVILALPSNSLKALKGLPEDVRQLLDSVIEYPLVKCFFVVRDPWWEGEADMPNAGASEFPTRELHYYRQGGRGMIMVYADRPTMYTWRPYVTALDHRCAETGMNAELPLAFARRMKITPEAVLSYGIRDFTRPPYGAGVHLWKPGVKPWYVSEKLEAFSLTGTGPKNVHVCGEAFSDFQGFMEGALRTAQNVMDKLAT